MIFKDRLISQIEYLKREKEIVEAELRSMPKGTMQTVYSKGNYYYYAKINGRKTSLLNKPVVIDAYKRKKLLTAQKRILEKDVRLLTNMHSKYTPFVPCDIKWESIKSEQNPYKTEDKKHKYKGVHYRSKSEMAIAALLTSYGIEFKYEPALELDGKTYYPDFIIKHPRTGALFIWEHCGVTSDSSYVEKMYEKLKHYHLNGYILGRHVIVSVDTVDGTIDGDLIDRLIKSFLL